MRGKVFPNVCAESLDPAVHRRGGVGSDHLQALSLQTQRAETLGWPSVQGPGGKPGGCP